MVDYRLDICAHCDTPTWARSSSKGPICRACDVELFFENILYRPIGFRLLAWQRKCLREIYGAVDIETGRRRFEAAYIEVAKKNGKSFLIGGLPLYHLTREGVENARAYGAAAAKDQAALVFSAAAQLWRASPILKDRLKLVESSKRIVRRDGGGTYQVIAADGDLQDGVEPTLTLMDELHRWKTNKARTLFQVLTAGDISVKEPLRIAITTAGDRYDSEICFLQHERARQILDGSLKSDKFYAAIYEADPKRLREDPEYWKTREARVAANPSHEDAGGFLKDDRITSKLEELGEPAYKRYHLNVWNQKDERWMPSDKWLACRAPLRTLIGKKCWLGLDLSKNTDFTALVAVYQDDDGSIDIQPYFWIPEEQLAKISKRLKLDLSDWVKKELLELTPGPAIEFACIRQRIDMLCEVANVQEICYDPRYAWEFIGSLEDKRTMVKIDQYGRKLDAPMQWLMKAVLEKKVRHGNNEIMNWMMECVTVTVDRDGLMKPDKEHLGRDAKRIDGVSALLTALVRVILFEPQDMGVFVGELG